MDYRSIQNETIELILDYGIDKIPIDIESLMDKMDIVRVPYCTKRFIERTRELSMKNSKDGFYDYDVGQGLFYVYYNDSRSPLRIKFTYGHEIRHIVHLDTYEDADIKTEANYFSRFLLVPIPLLIEIGIKNSDELVYIFNVSPEVAIYSLDFLKKHIHEYDEYTKNEIELLEMFKDEIEKCKMDLQDYRNRTSSNLDVQF